MTTRRKKKILVVGFLPPPHEGTSVITRVLASSENLFEKFGLSFLFLAKRADTASRGKFAAANLSLAAYNFARFLLKLVFVRPDIVYQPLAQNKTGFARDALFILASAIFRRKTVVHFHGGNFDRFYGDLGLRAKRAVKFIMKKPDGVVVLADRLKIQFSDFAPHEKIFTIYNCAPELPRLSGGSKDRVSFLYMGYLSKAKGAPDIVTAAAGVLKENPGAEFVLCGQSVETERNITFISDPHGGYSKIISTIKENGIGGAVRLVESADGAAKDALFRAAAVFVYPSYSEGCPIAVLEAMSYGLPLIVTPVGALPEMLKEGENCFFVEPGDTAALSDKMLRLINEPDTARRMGEANRRAVEKIYSKEAFVRGFERIMSRY